MTDQDIPDLIAANLRDIDHMYAEYRRGRELTPIEVRRFYLMAAGVE